MDCVSLQTNSKKEVLQTYGLKKSFSGSIHAANAWRVQADLDAVLCFTLGEGVRGSEARGRRISGQGSCSSESR